MLRTVLFGRGACVRLKSRLSCLTCNGGCADGTPLQGSDKRTTQRPACFRGPRVVLKHLTSCYAHLDRSRRIKPPAWRMVLAVCHSVKCSWKSWTAFDQQSYLRCIWCVRCADCASLDRRADHTKIALKFHIMFWLVRCQISHMACHMTYLLNNLFSLG